MQLTFDHVINLLVNLRFLVTLGAVMLPFAVLGLYVLRTLLPRE